MTDAPKRIWANTCVWGDGKPLAGEWNHKDVDSFLDTEYFRADIADEMLEALKTMVELARPYMRDDAQMIGLTEAGAAIAKAESGDT